MAIAHMVPPPARRSPGRTVLAALVVIGFAGGAAPASVAAEVVIGPVGGGLIIDGAVGEWLDRSPSLPPQAVGGGAGSGRVWLAESEDGLIVAGRVDGSHPRFPARPEELEDGDHLELAVTLVEDLPLPKIGWTEASGPVELAAAEDCARLEALADDRNAVADCEAWFGEQQAYRRLFRELFIRRWRLAPGLVEESLAGRSFAALPAAARDALKPLAPAGAPIARFTTPTDGGYSFEILVPWDALPPSPVLDLSRLHLSVDAVAAAAARGAPADAKPMLPARLEPPRRWQLSRCRYPLTDPDDAGPSRLPAYFLPTAGPEVVRIFTIANPAAGDRPGTAGLSPGIVPTTFFSQILSPDVAVCGPPLAVRRGETVARQSEVSVSPGLRVEPAKGGWLIADGPYADEERFATDECGGCPMISLRLFYLAAVGGLPVTVFDDAWPVEDADVAAGTGRNARVALRSDLRVIDAYEADPVEDGRSEWWHVRHCYDADAHVFKECGRWPKAPPPAGLAMPPEPPSP